MSAPIELAYLAAAAKIAGALAASGFLTDGAKVEVDPESTTEIDGEPADLVSAAILLKVETGPVEGRTRLGSGVGRYLIQREARLALANAGPNRDARDAVFEAALVALAPMPDLDPTLGGIAERWGFTGLEDADFEPSGRKAILSLFVRVRSGDALGRTP